MSPALQALPAEPPGKPTMAAFLGPSPVGLPASESLGSCPLPDLRQCLTCFGSECALDVSWWHSVDLETFLGGGEVGREDGLTLLGVILKGPGGGEMQWNLDSSLFF